MYNVTVKININVDLLTNYIVDKINIIERETGI